METKRFDLGDGDYIELYVEMKHGTSRRIQAIYSPYLRDPEVLKVISSKAPDEERISKITDIVGHSPDIGLANDALILGQTCQWTFGEINQDTLDEMPERKYELIRGAVNEMYGSVPLPKGGG